MPRLLRISRKPTVEPRSGFPFSVPAIAAFEPLDVNTAITFFVGENGSGKSTLLEAIAYAAELPTVGANQTASDPTLAPQRELGLALRLAWSVRSRIGFFMRAEDFFGHLTGEARTEARIWREKGLIPEAPVPLGFTGHIDEVNAERFVRGLDARSHGESFMDLFASRLRSDGLFLLDEPEAPLSPKRQLAFLGLVRKAVTQGAQFIIATHSPILLMCPGARIYSFDRTPIASVRTEDLEQVAFVREFLAAPAKFFA